MAVVTQWSNLDAIGALIARSSIVFADPAVRAASAAQVGLKAARLPASFDAVDLAVLEWIAAEGRRIGRGGRTRFPN